MAKKAPDNMERRAAHLSVPNLSNKIVTIYDKFPELRGKSVSFLASQGMEKLYQEALSVQPPQPAKSVKTQMARMAATSSPKIIKRSSEPDNDLLLERSLVNHTEDSVDVFYWDNVPHLDEYVGES